MRLQILISQYDKETDKVVKPLLDSIALQQNVDLANEVGVIIVNDGSDTELDRAKLDAYPFEIQYFKTEHRGVGGARNAALDAATADYVMFCDADDMFYNACGLWIVFSEMNKGPFDMLTSKFIEEIRTPGTHQPQYVDHEMDCTFIHGKFLRRAYLIDRNIRWNESIECHGDSYFNCLAQSLTDNVRYSPTPFYLWKWRDESVCRSDPKYMLRTYNDFLNSSESLALQLEQRGRRDKAEFYAVNTLFEAYYTLMKPDWLEEDNLQWRTACMLRCKSFYERFLPMLDTIAKDVLASIQLNARNKYFQECPRMELYTFHAWLDQLKAL